ncbi:SRPBCC domain-containing protein [Rhodohalobacter sp. SW132]|uniref:SRPBCC domain-containing protein n=1 Tax=Rhodohalobacter sp. SW132 TaxID=2293433 RepID=UPI000E287448|nr:SRPBCC domain-containing protein [Rhodohalobacter sp. SW132]REL24020.1 SRPBCC domain-containing protein [Rhodohalobacter sp. SW132]
MKTAKTLEDQKLILTRNFDAPPSLLFKIWSDCKHLKHWWGPKEWPMDECELDFRKGGQWKYCLRGPSEGDESWGLAIYQEIREPDTIAYKDHFTDAKGNVVPDMPNMIIQVKFEEHDGKTTQRITVNFDTNKERDKIVEMGMAEGMDSSLDRVDDYLAEIQ